MNSKMFQKEKATLEGVRGDVARRSLGVSRGASATFGTGVKFLDYSAKARIGLPSIVRIGVEHNLVAVVVHLNFAFRTNHFVSIRHSNHPRSFAISPKVSVRGPAAVSSPSRSVPSEIYRCVGCRTLRVSCHSRQTPSAHLRS